MFHGFDLRMKGRACATSCSVPTQFTLRFSLVSLFSLSLSVSLSLSLSLAPVSIADASAAMKRRPGADSKAGRAARAAASLFYHFTL